MGKKQDHIYPEGIVGLDKVAAANRIRADLLTPEEFGAMLDVSLHTIESWRKKGRGPDFVRLERRVYYRIADIQKWIRENVTPPHGDVGAHVGHVAPGDPNEPRGPIQPAPDFVTGTIRAPKAKA